MHEVKIVSPDNKNLLDIIEKGVNQLLDNPLVNGPGRGIPVLIIDRKSAEKALKIDPNRFRSLLAKLLEYGGGLASEVDLNSDATKSLNKVLRTIRETTIAPPKDYYKNSDSTKPDDDKEHK